MPHVWAVHITSSRPEDKCPEGPMEFAATSLPKAEKQAIERSKDPGVRAASVTRLTLDEPGSRKRISSFVHGQRQQYPHTTNNREHVIG